MNQETNNQPIVLDKSYPKGKPEIFGRNKGIEGHYNSCYLDATLFSMFAFNTTFDYLMKKNRENQHVIQALVDIIEPLRKNGFTEAEHVMKFRKMLLKFDSGSTEDEKDPEEFLNLLLGSCLKSDPLLRLTSNESSNIYQIFLEGNLNIEFPTVQHLFEASLRNSKIKLKEFPTNLVLIMPRFGNSFKLYKEIFPSFQLDMSEIVENACRYCFVCGSSDAKFECSACFKDSVDMQHRLATFCDRCNNLVHKAPCRQDHDPVPVENSTREQDSIRFMDLYAILCIETSHYVSFVKCGSGLDAQWCFFDSMADRIGDDIHGNNIPEVIEATDENNSQLNFWLTDAGFETLEQDTTSRPRFLKRLLKDVYMCMYRPAKNVD